jgi:hypothetical protein
MTVRLVTAAAGRSPGRPSLVAMAERRPIESEFAGIPEDDILQQARVTIDAVAEGRGGPRAAARLAAAQVVLSKAFLPHLTDQQLLYEVKRRTAAHKARRCAEPP